MSQEISLHIVLLTPPAGVDFCLQKGDANNYERIQKQRSTGKDLVFSLAVTVRKNKSNQLDFYGPFVYGPTGARFIYIDIGTAAGQFDSIWTRRLKIPLSGFDNSELDNALNNTEPAFTTEVQGTAKDGGPNCATVKPFAGWRLRG